MVIEYSKRAPFRAAITQTFDGAHPCSLCHAVNTGKTSEKKSDLQSPSPKIDMICATRTISLIPAFTPFAYAPIAFSSPERAHSPPVPPPRTLSRDVVHAVERGAITSEVATLFSTLVEEPDENFTFALFV